MPLGKLIDFKPLISLKGEYIFFIMNLKICFCIILLFGFDYFSYAQQANNYAFSTNRSSSLIALTSPTILIGNGAVNTSSSVTPIGFEFWFMGSRFTTFSINTNGAIQLGSTVILSAGNAYNIPNASRIVAFSAGERNATTGAVIGDWRVSPNGGVIHFQRFGNAPARTLVIECRNMNVNFLSTTNDATFQIILYESAPVASGNNRGGRIEFRYGQVQTTYDMNSLRIGIGFGENNNQFKGVDVSSDPPNATIGNDAIENRIPKGVIDVLNGATDGSRRVIVFEAPYPTAQATNLRLACTNSASEVKLDWDNAASNAVGSVLYRSTDGTNFSFLTQTPKGTNTFIDKGLTAGQTYYYRVYSVTEGKLSELHPTGQMTTSMLVGRTIKIDGKPVICNGVANLEAEQGFDTYEWYDSGGNLLKSDSTRRITITQAGKYKVIGKLNASSCENVGEVTVTECCEPVVEIPNAFTPHTTPSNNIFRIRHENLREFKIQIYDRWGVLVFFSEDPETGWNGNALGRPCELGVYQVIVDYVGCQDGRTVRGRKQEVLNLLE